MHIFCTNYTQIWMAGQTAGLAMIFVLFVVVWQFRKSML
jgi:hypothetical protein